MAADTHEFKLGPFRVLSTDEIPESVGDVVVLPEGASQYDSMPGYHDFCASRTGIHFREDGTVALSVSEVWEDAELGRRVGPRKNLVALRQNRLTHEISGYVFIDVTRIPGPDAPRRGEASAIPCRFSYGELREI